MRDVPWKFAIPFLAVCALPGLLYLSPRALNAAALVMDFIAYHKANACDRAQAEIMRRANNPFSVRFGSCTEISNDPRVLALAAIADEKTNGNNFSDLAKNNIAVTGDFRARNSFNALVLESYIMVIGRTGYGTSDWHVIYSNLD